MDSDTRIGVDDPDGAGRFFNGNIAEIIIYTGALSDENRRKVESYLAVKYGISL